MTKQIKRSSEVSKMLSRGASRWLAALAMVLGTVVSLVAGDAKASNSQIVASRPITVADTITMTRFGDPLYEANVSSEDRVATFSPDGKQFVVLCRRGNLTTNQNEYFVLRWKTAEIFNSAPPQTILSISSSSNAPAISGI